MLRRHFLTLTGLLGAAGVSQLVLAQNEVPPAQGAATNRFATELYHQLRQRPGNLFVSPLSISVALSMTTAGAAGNTRVQMEQALNLPADDTEHQAIRRLLAAVTGPGGQPDGAQPLRDQAAGPQGYQLILANAIYIQQGYVLREAFQQVVSRGYAAELESVDFAGDVEAVRGRINRWVQSQTQDKIQDLFAPGALDTLTRLVLANAIYFKGQWQDAFEPELTRPEPFTRADGSQVTVPLMHRKGDYRLLETPEFQLVEMPYQGEDVSMLVLLPRRVNGLAELERKLTADSWPQWSAQLSKAADLQLYIPKFKLETEYTLNEPLQDLGITDAFDDRRADFSGMVSEQAEGRLAISTVIHKAFCEVNEQGTEAAAATGVAIGITSVIAEPKVFRADRPFVFAIRHNPTSSLLFVGRVSDPKP